MSNESAMLVPKAPTIGKMEKISPTTYEAALRCTARAAWLASGDRALLPPHPRALLGIAVHAVLEQGRRGVLSGESEDERRNEAARLFDEKMSSLFGQTHPLIRTKFETQERIPYYNLYRARAAQMAADMPGRASNRPSTGGRSGTRVEDALASKDGRIAGRPDVLDGDAEAVVDYKTGSPADSQVSDNEARQLRLYAFLAAENGIAVRRGIIERADRRRAEVQISSEEAADEGRRALAVLDEYNRHVGEPFESSARPSPDACRYCPCIPLCEAFWEASEPGWQSECGTHVEGTVEAVDGEELVSVHLNVVRGTGPKGPAVVTRLSREWLTMDTMDVPRPGDTVRVTDAAYVEDSDAPAFFRADRVTTAVWRVPSDDDG